ncbi:MAG TPA: chemotaxis protein CheC [Myxococcota bacterium]|nr:chemotaxis protein CheC [Myxococcota bacterium]
MRTDDDDKLAELANICAGHAASTLALLLDGSLMTRVPRLRLLPAGRPLRSLFLREERVGAVFADLVGPYEAKAALLMSAGAVEEVVGRVSGKEDAHASALAILAEVGNIAVSAAANALAQMLGGVSLPSVPRAGYAPEGELELHELVEVVSCVRSVADVELYDRHGPLRMRFVLVPAASDLD